MSELPPLFAYLADESLQAAAAVVREYCGWHIAPVITRQVVIDGSGGVVQMLPSLRVVAVADVTNAGRLVSPDWSASGWLRLPQPWTDRERGVRATITDGYDECPAVVQAVVRRLARQGHGQLGSGSVRVGQIAITISAAEAAGVLGIDEYSAAALDGYRVP